MGSGGVGSGVGRAIPLLLRGGSEAFLEVAAGVSVGSGVASSSPLPIGVGAAPKGVGEVR